MRHQNVAEFCKLVETEHEKTVFDHLWKDRFEKKNYELDDFIGSAYKYLILHPVEGCVVGTFEAVPYDVNGPSTVQDIYDFSNEPEVKYNIGKVFEIDKLSINEKYVGIKTMLNAFACVMWHAEQHKMEYAIALLDPTLFDVFERYFKAPIRTLTNEPLDIRGQYKTVPVIIHMAAVYNNKELFPWYKKRSVLKEESRV